MAVSSTQYLYNAKIVTEENIEINLPEDALA